MDTSKIFNKLSRQYNFLNHLFSFGIDFLWRKRGANFVVNSLSSKQCKECKILDAACGTGDLSLIFARKGFNVIGIDISEKMLAIAEKRTKKFSSQISLILGDASSLNPEMSGLDAVTVAYGLRNFDDRKKALKEFYKVLDRGGVLMVLEFGRPTNKIIRVLYSFYFKRLMPLLASLFSGGKLYGEFKYFVKSVERFPNCDDFCNEIKAAGFKDVSYKKQTGGISILYMAKKS